MQSNAAKVFCVGLVQDTVTLMALKTQKGYVFKNGDFATGRVWRVGKANKYCVLCLVIAEDAAAVCEAQLHSDYGLVGDLHLEERLGDRPVPLQPGVPGHGILLCKQYTTVTSTGPRKSHGAGSFCPNKILGQIKA